LKTASSKSDFTSIAVRFLLSQQVRTIADDKRTITGIVDDAAMRVPDQRRIVFRHHHFGGRPQSSGSKRSSLPVPRIETRETVPNVRSGAGCPARYSNPAVCGHRPCRSAAALRQNHGWRRCQASRLRPGQTSIGRHLLGSKGAARLAIGATRDRLQVQPATDCHPGYTCHEQAYEARLCYGALRLVGRGRGIFGRCVLRRPFLRR